MPRRKIRAHYEHMSEFETGRAIGLKEAGRQRSAKGNNRTGGLGNCQNGCRSTAIHVIYHPTCDRHTSVQNDHQQATERAESKSSPTVTMPTPHTRAPTSPTTSFVTSSVSYCVLTTVANVPGDVLGRVWILALLSKTTQDPIGSHSWHPDSTTGYRAFGCGLDDETLAILASAKACLCEHYINIELRTVDPDLVWRRTLSSTFLTPRFLRFLWRVRYGGGYSTHHQSTNTPAQEILSRTEHSHKQMDGSQSSEGVGAGVILPPPLQTIQLKLHQECSAFQAELLAILYATKITMNFPKEHFIIASDCQSALSAICRSWPPRTQLIAEIIYNLHFSPNVQLCWIKGHSGIPGNELADQAAKAAAHSNLPLSFTTLPKSVARGKKEQIALKMWTDLYIQDYSTRNLRRFAATPKLLLQMLRNIKHGSTSTTILTGHGYIQADLATVSKEYPTCPHCQDEDQTVDHLLFTCPTFQYQRFQTATLLGITNICPASLENLPRKKSAWRHLINWTSTGIAMLAKVGQKRKNATSGRQRSAKGNNRTGGLGNCQNGCRSTAIHVIYHPTCDQFADRYDAYPSHPCTDKSDYIFCDKFRFLLCPDDCRKRAWRRPGQRVDPGLTVENHTGPQQGVMVWDAISFDSRTPLLVIPGTLTAQRYVDDILRPVLLPFLSHNPGLTFQQDNARPHVLLWIVFNLAEHFPRQLETIWQEIPQHTIRNLYQSMTRRVAVSIQARLLAFGCGLDDETLAILASAKACLCEHYINIELRTVDPDLVWRRTLSSLAASSSSNSAARALGNWADCAEDLRPGADDHFTVVKSRKRCRESAANDNTSRITYTPLPAPRPAGPTPPAPHGDTTTPAMATPPPPLSAQMERVLMDKRWKVAGDLIHELSREIDLEHTFQSQVDVDDIVKAILYPGDREPLIKRLPTRDRYILGGFISTAIWRARDSDPSHKSVRRVFLFEELVVFSKAKPDPQRPGYDLYQYKFSLKTCELGLTRQPSTQHPARFEIWFRKCRAQDTYTLQAQSQAVKEAWVEQISRLLWNQAFRNRELRNAENSSMGMGSKPCLEIRPNQDQISDSVRRCRPHSIISVSSSSSGHSGVHKSDASHCSTESGFFTDLESGHSENRRAERSDSLLPSVSYTSNPPDILDQG
ncbi:PLEKHG4 [Cordylochernes scorpioides]|uniref:PLEKHG4 n=1 Tax=Cordylochernes scorpioides TaxID=51811 RepID=A0ABY6LQ88_9ARAC|nr:PLEKHG4 [Cordylochernes scorpioides]